MGDMLVDVLTDGTGYDLGQGTISGNYMTWNVKTLRPHIYKTLTVYDFRLSVNTIHYGGDAKHYGTGSGGGSATLYPNLSYDPSTGILSANAYGKVYYNTDNTGGSGYAEVYIYYSAYILVTG